MPRPLALTWAFNTVLSMASFVVSNSWDECPWFSRVGATLLIPIGWCFAIVCYSTDATGRRVCLGSGMFFLGLGLTCLVADGPTWQSFRQASFVLGNGVGLLLAAAAGRAARADDPDSTRSEHVHD